MLLNVVLGIVALFALVSQLLILGWMQRLVRAQRVSIALQLELNQILSIAVEAPQKSLKARQLHQEAGEVLAEAPSLMSLQAEIDRFVTQSGFDAEDL